MSTVPSDTPLVFNPARPLTPPGLRGRRLRLTCEFGHLVPARERIALSGPDWSCRYPSHLMQPCGSRRRQWTWSPAPLHRAAWHWAAWSLRRLFQLLLPGDRHGQS